MLIAAAWLGNETDRMRDEETCVFLMLGSETALLILILILLQP